MSRVRLCVVFVAGLLTACSVNESDAARRTDLAPSMQWDHTSKGTDWTKTAMAALRDHGMPLASTVPDDIEAYCPGYKTASTEERQAFWVGLLSSLSKHESTWRETAVGGGGRWYGLFQISPGTARAYGCEAKSGKALLDGAKNVNCAIRIMSHTVPRDNVISQGMRGVAADWGPFHSSSKRKDIMGWTRSQPYCQAKG